MDHDNNSPSGLLGIQMKIKQFMLDNDLTQKQLAELCGTTQGAISNAIKNDFIIINWTVYSPRFDIDESKLKGDK